MLKFSVICLQMEIVQTETSYMQLGNLVLECFSFQIELR